MKRARIEASIKNKNTSDGFTLVEVVIAMAVSAIIGIAVVANSVSQQQASTAVREISQLQQQLRGALYIMERDIRIAGYDPEGSGLFGVINMQRWTITDETTPAAPGAAGFPSLTVAYDWDPANPASSGNGLRDEPMPAYRLFDDNNDGIIDLVRDDDNGFDRQLVAEGIEAIGFAFAYDNDGDGAVDRTAVGNNIIWAVDSDNDNQLDTNLDATDDGVIDLEDDTDDDFRIRPTDSATGGVGPVPQNRIRMVRVWLLARARNAARDSSNQGQSFLVGDQVVPAQAGGFTDNVRRRLLVRTVDCRNTGI